MARRLVLKGDRRLITITTIKDQAEPLEVRDVSLDVSSRDGNNRIRIESAYVVPASKFRMPSQSCPVDYHGGDIYTQLDGIELDVVNPEDISILIGANAPESLLPIEVRRGRGDQPLAIKTKFGWTLFGSSGRCGKYHTSTALLHSTKKQKIQDMLEPFWLPDAKNTICNLIHSTDEDRLQELLLKFWMQEHKGILPPKDGMSRQDTLALKRLQKCTKLKQNRYEVPILWKDGVDSLPNNFLLTRRRFEFLLKRLKADPELFRQYKETISSYVEKG